MQCAMRIQKDEACTSQALINLLACGVCLQVSELKARCNELPALQEAQRQLAEDVSEAERLATLNSELRLRGRDLSSLQQEAERLGPLAEEAQLLKQQLQEMREEAEELPAVKVGQI